MNLSDAEKNCCLETLKSDKVCQHFPFRYNVNIFPLPPFLSCVRSTNSKIINANNILSSPLFHQCNLCCTQNPSKQRSLHIHHLIEIRDKSFTTMIFCFTCGDLLAMPSLYQIICPARPVHHYVRSLCSSSNTWLHYHYFTWRHSNGHFNFFLV